MLHISVPGALGYQDASDAEDRGSRQRQAYHRGSSQESRRALLGMLKESLLRHLAPCSLGPLADERPRPRTGSDHSFVLHSLLLGKPAQLPTGAEVRTHTSTESSRSQDQELL